ncbi:hypothetical protein AB0J38_12030 [Streptomyces sp. NPDC050095]|uniref:hypothetical protein n=1 Tax=unclassified Streptomyces TaxID=2593676 RepID=UPI00341F2729
MGDTARPIPERLGDQDVQAQHLVRTSNGPTVDDEVVLLAEQYGAADMAGFHTGSAAVDQDAHEPTAQDDVTTVVVEDGGEPT